MIYFYPNDVKHDQQYKAMAENYQGLWEKSMDLYKTQIARNIRGESTQKLEAYSTK